MAHSFEIEGIRFELDHLNVDDACAGLETLGKVMAGSAAAGGFNPFALLSQAGHAPTLLRLFAPVCKVSRSRDGTFRGGDMMVDLKPFAGDVFRGRADVLVKFLRECVDFEYASFLAAWNELVAEATTSKP